MSGSDVYYSLRHGKRLERPSRCPLFIYQLMLKCWEWDETKRPTFYQLVHLLKTDTNHRQSDKTTRKSLCVDDNINENDHKSNAIIQF
jgi:focal adhesion kinase 1